MKKTVIKIAAAMIALLMMACVFASCAKKLSGSYQAGLSLLGQGADVTYTFSHMEEDKEVTSTFEVPASRAYLGDELMVSFSDIAAWLDMAQVGDIHTMRFVVREGDDQSVVFHYNSHNAFIGHEIVVMSAETRFVGGEVWVPLSFVQICMKGFDITVEGDNVRISRNGDAPGFALRASEPIAPCEYPD